MAVVARLLSQLGLWSKGLGFRTAQCQTAGSDSPEQEDVYERPSLECIFYVRRSQHTAIVVK